MDNAIPLSRGLGSSAAATVAGVVAGAELAARAGGDRPGDEALLQIASTIESHPDNAAAVLLGGFVVSAQLADRVAAIRFDAPAGLRCVLYIPDRRLATEDMRRVLPERGARCATPSRTWAGSRSVSPGSRRGRYELLADLTIDRLHEPYRSVAYPELPRMTMAAREAGALGAFLSGAGSTILAFVAPGGDAAPVEAALRDEADACGLAGRIAVVEPRNHGAHVVASGRQLDRLRHGCAVDRHAVGHGHDATLDLAESVALVERHAGHRADEDQGPEALGLRGRLARLEDPRPEALARPSPGG